jgi:adenine/guanine phosphoribosyltransferase-like PRPP-binding protein
MIRMGSAWIAATADSRGNRLLEYEPTKSQPPGRYFINARCCSDVAEHIALVLEEFNPRPVDPIDTNRWTYRFEYDGPRTTSLSDSLDLLKEVLILRTTPEMDGALALDFYKVPEDDVPSNRWANTPAGELIHRGKYYGDTASGKELADRIATVIRTHLAYSSVDAVIAIPGTERKFGERLAGGVAKRLSIPCIPCERSVAATSAAKTGRERVELEDFSIEASAVSGRRLVIVDDVYWSGITMRSVAKAARSSGATSILGIAGARNLRK